MSNFYHGENFCNTMQAGALDSSLPLLFCRCEQRKPILILTLQKIFIFGHFGKLKEDKKFGTKFRLFLLSIWMIFSLKVLHLAKNTNDYT